MRLPKHIGIIPDGNRRWAEKQGRKKEEGYIPGIAPGKTLYFMLKELGVEEMTVYGFTNDNTRRPTVQKQAFTSACVSAAEWLSGQDAELLVIGNSDSPAFPPKLLPFTTRQQFGSGGMKINFLINYSWQWDLGLHRGEIGPQLKTRDISRVDLIIRWGGRRRLSGFLPVQSAYADFFIVEDLWPDFKKQHVLDALAWYDKQDITLGG